MQRKLEIGEPFCRQHALKQHVQQMKIVQNGVGSADDLHISFIRA
jgi:hypothetical protein